MRTKLSIIALVATATLTTSCHSHKNAVRDNVDTPATSTVATPPATTVSTPAQSNNPEAARAIATTFGSWNTMQCGGSITLGGKTTFSSSVNVRMQRDKFIYISLRPLLGIEVARLVVTDNQVILVDKVHRQYICEDVKLLTNGLPATVGMLQDIFLGRAFTLEDGTYNIAHSTSGNVTNENGKYVLRPNKKTQGFSYEFTFDTSNHILALTVIPDGAKTTNYTVDYSDVRRTKAGNVAHALNIASTIKGNALKLGLEFKEISWDGTVKADTDIPTNYKKVDASNITNLLGGE